MTLGERLARERNVWLTTLRADGSPHVTPIWFVWLDGAFWCCTPTTSVKVRNLSRDPRATAALEDGNRPVVAEGDVLLHARPYPAAVVEAFSAKFDWDISSGDEDGDYGALLELRPRRWLLGGPAA